MNSPDHPGTPPDEEYGEKSGLSTRNQIQEKFHTNPENWFHWVFDRLALPPESLILELGGGLGDLWEQNLDRLPDGWKIVFSDYEAPMISRARQAVSTHKKQFSFSVLDAQAIPFPKETFEAAIGIGLLDQLPAPWRALDEISRVLKPGGHFFISAGGRTHLQELEGLVRPFLPDVNYGGLPERFGLENGEKMLARWFPRVALYHYRDELVFDRPGPVIAYALSEADVKEKLSGEKRAAFERFIRQKLDKDGHLSVTSNKGLFVARL